MHALATRKKVRRQQTQRGKARSISASTNGLPDRFHALPPNRFQRVIEHLAIFRNVLTHVAIRRLNLEIEMCTGERCADPRHDRS